MRRMMQPSGLVGVVYILAWQMVVLIVASRTLWHFGVLFAGR